jgi:rod shape-determining protein MreD
MTSKHIKIRAVVVYAVYVFFLGLFQATLLSRVTILGSAPDLTLVLAILAGYLFGMEDGAIIGLAAGFMRDMLAGRAIGLGMLLLMYSAILASIIFKQLFRRNVILGLAQIVIITIFYETVVMILTFIVPMLPDVSLKFSSLVLRTLYNLPGHLLGNLAAAIPLIFLLYFAGPYRRGSRKDEPVESIVRDSAWRVN